LDHNLNFTDNVLVTQSNFDANAEADAVEGGEGEVERATQFQRLETSIKSKRGFLELDDIKGLLFEIFATRKLFRYKVKDLLAWYMFKPCRCFRSRLDARIQK